MYSILMSQTVTGLFTHTVFLGRSTDCQNLRNVDGIIPFWEIRSIHSSRQVDMVRPTESLRVLF